MNCYYSNLIEGHDTHPWDIEQALSENYSNNPKNRDLQKEAVAHIEVQKMIDQGHDPKAYPATKEYILWLHREFCQRLPEDMLWVKNPETGEKIQVTPGIMRQRGAKVGQHIAPPPESLEMFMQRFEQAYNPDRLTKFRRIIASACAHHRLLWIHPFSDGNGRVARLMSYVMLLREGVGNNLWSVARGLAKNVEPYKKLLAAADQERQGDLDGRGSLSEKALVDFCRFFLEICIDQVDYMGSILNLPNLLRRLELFVKDEIIAGNLRKGSYPILRETLLSGKIERGSAPELTGYKERMARNTVSTLLEKRIVGFRQPKRKSELGFSYRDRWKIVSRPLSWRYTYWQ